MLTQEEQEWLALMRVNDRHGLKQIFSHHYKFLVGICFDVLEDEVNAKKIAQDVMYNLWKKRNNLNEGNDLKDFLKKKAIAFYALLPNQTAIAAT